MTSELEALGWGADFEETYQAFCAPLSPDECARMTPVRIVGVQRQTFQVRGLHGEEEARLAGASRHAGALTPAIGDWCVLEMAPEGGGRLLAVLPRRTTFARALGASEETRRPQAVRQQVIAANVDLVLIVTTPDADFDLERLERYVLAVQQSGARPVLVLNKADLHANTDWWVQQLRTLGPELEIHVTFAESGQGLEGVRSLLTGGVTLALIGSSGVGKSTLTNALLGRPAAPTGEVRASDQQGRHTTTSRTLYTVPGGGLLIDNPGLRDIAVWDADAADFGELEALAAQCRFRKCTHTTEPGCAVQAAVQAGKVSATRLAAFQAQQSRRARR
ncbi:ribosome small subunit-dependent GTPase A [Deinococcus humi]|uniref:Small ribosomal subunit biogenesis GTPase RsgA n=1 Tax=Deinococcus humi TaxID=662880 RepID=A0A7W8NFL6_9DEIO|nr:ribosome small subunit-dependent GTPase A [Deinococcus humi]MBB5362893.1 ribosome biogenesis GTPase [Deinococcus humi]GGO25794.1 putative ribosome biogenesis GTPase RsgA [Deinococcus humi]